LLKQFHALDVAVDRILKALFIISDRSHVTQTPQDDPMIEQIIELAILAVRELNEGLFRLFKKNCRLFQFLLPGVKHPQFAKSFSMISLHSNIGLVFDQYLFSSALRRFIERESLS